MGDSDSSEGEGEGVGLGVRAPTLTGVQVQNKTEQKFGARLSARPAAAAAAAAAPTVARATSLKVVRKKATVPPEAPAIQTGVSISAAAEPPEAPAIHTGVPIAGPAATAASNFDFFSAPAAAAPKAATAAVAGNFDFFSEPAAAAAAAAPKAAPKAATAAVAGNFDFFSEPAAAAAAAPKAVTVKAATAAPIKAAPPAANFNFANFEPAPTKAAAAAAANFNFANFEPTKAAAAPFAAAVEFPAAAEGEEGPLAPPIHTGVPIDGGVPTLVVSELPTVSKTIAAAAAAARGPVIVKTEPAPLKPIALPADAPLLAKEDFTEELKKRFKGPDPAQVKPDGIAAIIDPKKGSQTVIPYRPVTSAAFSDFITQTYSQYSPYLIRILQNKTAGMSDAEAIAAAAVPKEVDQDACKKRDPNKVETFYYQSFVRDYLSYGSPYRGLLVYHGLGSGKTCTSIAAAEALYWGGQKKIYVLTPATLSNNYRKDLAKCGYYPLRSNNFWAFLALAKGREAAADPNYAWLVQGLGLPPNLVVAQGGGWIPNPDKATNWADLSPDVKDAIKAQQIAHLNHRFHFIHYNGVSPLKISTLAAEGVVEGKSMFDDAVVIIDEIHNLVRTINGTMIGNIPMSKFIETVEQREPTWSAYMTQKTPGYKYPRGYALYRLLQNAVGAKIIALSATPMINYAQEFAILLNLIGGEQRMVEISLKSMSRDPKVLGDLEAWARQRPDIDFYSVEEGENSKTVLNVTPVPFGFVKVVTGDYATRGFVRLPPIKVGSVKNSRERNMDKWAATLIAELEATHILKGVSAEASAAAAAAAAAAASAVIDRSTNSYRLHTFPMLPDDPKVFIPNFVDRSTLKILHRNVLKARASGLISYYRGGSEELMPRTGKNELILVPMSDYMFKRYSMVRLKELEMDTPEEPSEEEPGKAKRKGMTAGEADLYEQATKSLATGFLCGSRAACNFVFPEDVPRPFVDAKKQEKMLGIEKDRVLSVDAAVEPRAATAGGKKRPTIPKAATASAAGGAGAGAAAAASEAPEGTVIPDEEDEAPPEPVDPTIVGLVSGLMSGLEAKGDIYLNASLPEFSAKYATMLDNIRRSPGPALVYSQFITLEGLGIFAAAMRASPEKYMQLDLIKDEGEWVIPDELLTPESLARPRYILYTGAQDPEKRRLCLQLYNADLAALPRRLREQCELMLAGAPDNRDGRVCRVFMISSSGAEGISLFNTRQVNIMEPYWNNVRLQQVTGRAIRLCSHMNLPWEDRVVDVYTYMSVFSAKQKAEGSKALMRADNSMTTDQIIYTIATKKQKLADGLYEIAQTAATDCEIHFHEHGAVTQCYKFAEGSRPMFAYHPDWQKDIKNMGVRAAAASDAPAFAAATSVTAAAGAGEGEGEGEEDE